MPLLSSFSPILKPTLPFIADEQIPKTAAEAERLAGVAEGIGEEIERAISSQGTASAKDRAAIRELYELVDRMRIGAKDAQNYTDRSLAISHAFVPMLEAKYPCGGADIARNMAHGLHVWIGRTKDVIGNPVKISGDAGAKDDSATAETQSGRGAADILKTMERELGRISGSRPAHLHRMDPEELSIPPLLTAALTLPLNQARRFLLRVGTEDCERKQDVRRRLHALAHFL